MPEDRAPPPVAIRITRPYTTEDEFLEQELDTLSRTSVTLLGAQPRPQGVVLRFELVLASGHVLMRGEGRVVAFKPNAHQGLGGLTLRFTRLDSRSKTLVDRATTLRERRRPSGVPARPDPESAPPPPPVAAEAAPASRPPPAPPAPVRRSGPPAPLVPRPAPLFPREEAAPATAGDREAEDGAPVDLESTHAEAPTSKRSERPSGPPPLPQAARSPSPPGPPPPGGRDALLARLRKRADSLDAAAMQRILDRKKRHATDA